MRATLVVGHGVDFIDYDGLNVAENRAALIGRKKDVERFRRGNQNMRWTLQHRAPLWHQGIAGANRGTNFGHQQATLAGNRKNLTERNFKIFLNVVAQGLQWRNV